MNELQKELDEIAREEAYKSVTRNLDLPPSVEVVIRTAFNAGWRSCLATKPLQKALNDL